MNEGRKKEKKKKKGRKEEGREKLSLLLQIY